MGQLVRVLFPLASHLCVSAGKREQFPCGVFARQWARELGATATVLRAS